MLAQTVTEPAYKPTEYGTGLIVKELDDKIIVTAEQNTRLYEGNFLLEAKEIKVEAGPGIKISSRGRDTLVISANLTKLDERIFDLMKHFTELEKRVDDRLVVIEKVFSKFIKSTKT